MWITAGVTFSRANALRFQKSISERSSCWLEVGSGDDSSFSSWSLEERLSGEIVTSSPSSRLNRDWDIFIVPTESSESFFSEEWGRIGNEMSDTMWLWAFTDKTRIRKRRGNRCAATARRNFELRETGRRRNETTALSDMVIRSIWWSVWVIVEITDRTISLRQTQ